LYLTVGEVCRYTRVVDFMSIKGFNRPKNE
jgi:hypothetical protein